MTENGNKSHSWFEWIQLIATICVPVAIGLFTIIQNQWQSEQQKSGLKIAAENRLNDIEIADRNRAKDQWIADDQQKENILIDYQNFLANLLEKNGLILNQTPAASLIARFRTLSALSQLNPVRRSFLIRSLYEARLITFKNIEIDNVIDRLQTYDTLHGIIDLSSANLSGLSLGINENNNDDCPNDCIPGVRIDGLALSRTHLINAFFRKIFFQGVLFVETIMNDADFRCALLSGSKDKVSFAQSQLMRANFRKVCARGASFQSANLENAQMQHMTCLDCVFHNAQMSRANLNNIVFDGGDDSINISYDEYENINFTDTLLIDARFNYLSLRGAYFIRANLSRVHITNCIFSRDPNCCAAATFEQSTLINATIENSLFEDVYFIESSLTGATISKSIFTKNFMKNIDLTDATLDMCHFNHSNLAGCIMNNTKIDSSYFVEVNLTGCVGVTDEQLAKAKSIAGAILPNGTKIPS